MSLDYQNPAGVVPVIDFLIITLKLSFSWSSVLFFSPPTPRNYSYYCSFTRGRLFTKSFCFWGFKIVEKKSSSNTLSTFLAPSFYFLSRFAVAELSRNEVGEWKLFLSYSLIIGFYTSGCTIAVVLQLLLVIAENYVLDKSLASGCLSEKPSYFKISNT